jgi:hypothetical protein
MAEIPAPPAPENETAAQLFRTLVQLHDQGKVSLHLDFGRLNHMDSPVGVEADSNIWAYGGVALALLAFWLGGTYWALGVAAAGIAIYYTIGRAYVRKRLGRRIEERAFRDIDLWQKLWRWGGVSLVPDSGGEACVAPKGNWLALVRGLRDRGQERSA